jgi:hypothetical protein
MDNEFDFNLESDQFTLESILSDYYATEALYTPQEDAPPPTEESRPIPMEPEADTLSAVIEEPPAPETEPEPEPESVSEAYEETESYAAADFEPWDDPAFMDDSELPGDFEIPDDPAPAEPAPEEAAAPDAAIPDGAAPEPEKSAPRRKQPPIRKKSFGETVMRPVLTLLAVLVEKQRALLEQRPAGDAPEEDPELPPKKAARLYAMQLRPLVFRSRAATFLCVLLTYITFAWTGFLPLFGALGHSSRVCALVCLILLSSVLFAGVDILVAGARQLLAVKPGAEALAFLSALFSMLDAALVASGRLDYGLPLCAVSAWSVCLGIWGSRWTCQALYNSFSVLADTEHSPTAITAEPGIAEDANCVVKTEISTEGFVRRSECADLSEIAHIVAAPFLLALAFVLSLLACVHLGAGAFIHIFSAMLASAAGLTALIAFPILYAAGSARLKMLDSAVAGCEGCADIGSAERFVVLDRDLFPPHTITIDKIQISDRDRTEKVIGYTGSLIAASGSALAPVFTGLMAKRGCVMSRVEDFQHHEGGGLIAQVDGDEVLVGSAGFMSLMGVRLPFVPTAQNAVFTVINGSLAGIFTLTYTATASVQRALEILLRDYRFPIFAVRDFNINPMMIRQKFKVVTDDFEFPPFEERYRVSAVEHDPGSPISAAVTRTGLGVMVECVNAARNLYNFTRILVAVSLICSVLGMVIVLLLSRGDAPSAVLGSRLLLFLLASVAPALVISYRMK